MQLLLLGKDDSPTLITLRIQSVLWRNTQVVPTMKQVPYLGTSFVLLVLACVLLAGCLLVSERREVVAAPAARRPSVVRC
jgi:hypothetical protein